MTDTRAKNSGSRVRTFSNSLEAALEHLLQSWRSLNRDKIRRSKQQFQVQKKRNDRGRYEKLQIKFRAKKKPKEKAENASATTRACERGRARNTNRGRPACRLQQRKQTTTSLDEKKFINHPSEAIYSLALRKRPRENANHGWASNEWPFHTSISPSMSNGMRKPEDE